MVSRKQRTSQAHHSPAAFRLSISVLVGQRGVVVVAWMLFSRILNPNRVRVCSIRFSSSLLSTSTTHRKSSEGFPLMVNSPNHPASLTSADRRKSGFDANPDGSRFFSTPRGGVSLTAIIKPSKSNRPTLRLLVCPSQPSRINRKPENLPSEQCRSWLKDELRRLPSQPPPPVFGPSNPSLPRKMPSCQTSPTRPYSAATHSLRGRTTSRKPPCLSTAFGLFTTRRIL